MMKLLMYLLRYKGATQECLIDIILPGTKRNSSCLLPILFTIVSTLASLTQGHSQENILTLEQVFDIVRRYHPVAKQANLIVDSAEANRLSAKGGFDPSFYISNQQKTFDGKNYYFYTNPELKIPTWYGIDFKAGLEDNGGDRLTTEATKGRSSYVGMSLPLLKNLVTDRRRTTLQQARILVKQGEAVRRNELNNLLFDAATAYWNWVREHQVYKVTTNVVSINEARLQLVRRSFFGGDRAAIDTVEALTQLQNFQFMASEAQYRWLAAGLELSNFLWLENEQPFQLPANVIPDTAWSVVNVHQHPVPSLENALATAKSTHPKIQTYDQKLQVLEAERRLKFQSLLPSLNFNYNFLNKGYEPWKGVGQNVFENNYKYGIEFGLPLFLRQGRGEYKGAKIKIQATDLQRDQATLEIENKVRDYFNQVVTLRTQVKIYEDAYNNYLRLLRAEETKFSIGESSLFLLNSRENKVLEIRQKLLELKTKFFKSLVAVQWATGNLK
ncbi:TolC family protein [Segetibacter aerophilus]|uniref:Transporter n=1 Tax=Segetibacter aerophilus TaxID=670293 RepID=A0A512BK27_9BACT|nr:TolC family protein [Segetibacter aerophilus]GEO12177.1 transporter [Segetibacter aerophilus]